MSFIRPHCRQHWLNEAEYSAIQLVSWESCRWCNRGKGSVMCISCSLQIQELLEMSSVSMQQVSEPAHVWQRRCGRMWRCVNSTRIHEARNMTTHVHMLSIHPGLRQQSVALYCSASITKLTCVKAAKGRAALKCCNEPGFYQNTQIYSPGHKVTFYRFLTFAGGGCAAPGHFYKMFFMFECFPFLSQSRHSTHSSKSVGMSGREKPCSDMLWSERGKSYRRKGRLTFVTVIFPSPALWHEVSGFELVCKVTPFLNPEIAQMQIHIISNLITNLTLN